VRVDGTSVGARTSYTFSSVSANHSLQASFAPVTPNAFTVTTSAGSGGSVSPAGATTVNQGGSLTVAITPASGYQVADVRVDGTSVGARSSYTFSAVSVDHTLQADFLSELDASLTPVLRGPVNGGTVVTRQPEISVYNPIHATERVVSYEFELARDPQMTQLVTSASGQAEGTGYTAWAPPRGLRDGSRYYWRARATAETVSSPWSPVCTFYLDTRGQATSASDPITAFVVADQPADLEVVDPTSSAYQVALDLPAGTLPYDFVAMVQTIENPPPATTFRLLGKVYEFGPNGLPLSQKVSISLPYTAQDLTDAGVLRPEDLSVLTYNTETLAWEPVPIAGVDGTANRMICEVEHFSMYAVGTSNASGSSSGGTSPRSRGGGWSRKSGGRR
jgi:hypothetical protein